MLPKMARYAVEVCDVKFRVRVLDGMLLRLTGY